MPAFVFFVKVEERVVLNTEVFEVNLAEIWWRDKLNFSGLVGV